MWKLERRTFGLFIYPRGIPSRGNLQQSVIQTFAENCFQLISRRRRDDIVTVHTSNKTNIYTGSPVWLNKQSPGVMRKLSNVTTGKLARNSKSNWGIYVWQQLHGETAFKSGIIEHLGLLVSCPSAFHFLRPCSNPTSDHTLLCGHCVFSSYMITKISYKRSIIYSIQVRNDRTPWLIGVLPFCSFTSLNPGLNPHTDGPQPLV